MSLLITLLYFSLHLIDPELVVPADLALPLPTDLSFHLNPIAFLLIDLLFLSPLWTITALPALALSSLIAALYYVWVERCYERNGFYPYPIFDLVGAKGRVGLFVGSAVCMAGGTVVLRVLQGRVLGGLGREMKRD
jgi:FAR-17a/AIG1-like protein